MDTQTLLDSFIAIGSAPRGAEAEELRREQLIGEIESFGLAPASEEAFLVPDSAMGTILGAVVALFFICASALVAPAISLLAGAAWFALVLLSHRGRIGNWLTLARHRTALNLSLSRGVGRPLVLLHASLDSRGPGGAVKRLCNRFISQKARAHGILIAQALAAIIGPLVVVLYGWAGLLVMAVLLVLCGALCAVHELDGLGAASAPALSGMIAALKTFDALGHSLDKQAEIRLLFTEADRHGFAGIRTYLDRHEDQIIGRPLHVVSFDHVGAGVPTLIHRVGEGLSRDVSGPFNAAFDQARLAAKLVSDRSAYGASDVPALAAARKGAACAIIMGLAENGDRSGDTSGRADRSQSISQQARQIDDVAAFSANALRSYFIETGGKA